MEEVDIEFDFEGIWYTLPTRAYDCYKIVLPDSRLLNVGMWVETSPPTPALLTLIPHLFTDRDPDTIAKNVGGVCAKKVKKD